MKNKLERILIVCLFCGVLAATYFINENLHKTIGTVENNIGSLSTQVQENTQSIKEFLQAQEKISTIEKEINQNTKITKEYLKDRESIKRILDQHNKILLIIINKMKRRRV